MEEEIIVQSKPHCLIILDLLFWLMPEMKVFGGTVRDILSHSESHHLHILIDTMSQSTMIKKFNRLVDSLEIYGFSICLENCQSHSLVKNLSQVGIAQAIVSKYGSNDKKIKLLLVTPSKMYEYYPVFRCDLLYLTKDGDLQLRECPSLSKYRSHLSSQRVQLIQEVLEDIGQKRLVLLEPVQVKNGYENRFIRSKIAYKLIRLQERGWQPIDFSLEDCGINLEVNQIKERQGKEIYYPNLEEIERLELYGNLDDIPEIEGEICAICQEELSRKSSVKTKCNHYFHNRCLFQHFYKIGGQASLCPICREVLVREVGQPCDDEFTTI